MNKTKVFITIDVEASIAGCFSDPSKYKPLLTQPVYGYKNNKSHGLGFILATLAEHQLNATFFTESLQSRYFGYDTMSEVVKKIQSYQQDIQLHVHPCWTNFDNGTVVSTKYNDHSSGRSAQEMVDIFAEAIDRFVKLGADKPVAVRTGSFSCDIETFKALAKLNVPLSSNVAMGISPPASVTLQNYHGYHEIEGVIDLPLTTFNSYSVRGQSVPRSMAVTACSAQEIITILNQAHQQQLDSVCILTHPFEFFKISNFQYHNICSNKLTQQRFKTICQFLAKNTDRFSTSDFRNLANSKINTKQHPVSLQGSYPQALTRAGANFCYDSLKTVI